MIFIKTIGLIAEYNPFHNGHLYQLKKIKELFPDSLIILILNGYFTQRGTISIQTKEAKTKIALENNIDLVIELPFIYGTQSSDNFALYSIKLLEKLHTDYLVFGSESNNLELLKKVANIQLNDTNYPLRVKSYLENGINYPTALAKALNIIEDINKPNDLLGISYIKAINKLNSKIEPITIKRTSDYHDTYSTSSIISASNIRQKLINKEDISPYLPSYSLTSIIEFDEDKLLTLLKFKILTDKDLSAYLDVDEGIEFRLLKVVNQTKTLDELIQNVKTKRYTYNKISRMLTHILIGLTKKDAHQATMDYLKILGFSKEGQSYLKKIRKDLDLPTTPIKDSLIYKYELLSSSIFEQITKISTYSFDFQNKPIQPEK